MTFRFGFVSAVVSTLLHVAVIAVMSARPAPESVQIRTNSPRVSVRLVASQPQRPAAKPARVAPLSRRPAPQAGLVEVSSDSVGTELPTIAPENEKPVDLQTKTPSLSLHSDVSGVTMALAQEASELLSPCSHLRLPQRWLSIPEFFPRRYDIELEIPDGSNSNSLKVVSMRPASKALEYADNVIRQAFEVCLAELVSESVQALGQRISGQGGMTNGLFSVKVEFQSVSNADELRKGI